MLKIISIRLILLLSLGFSPLLLADEFKLPKIDDRVNDFADFLDSATEDALRQNLQSLEQETSAQFVIVTVADLQGIDIAEYGLELGRKFGIGQADKNNGLILLIAKAERKIRIEVGYGLEGVIPDAYASYIINAVMRPKFRNDDYAGGIKQAVEKLTAKIKGDPAAEPMESYRQNNLEVLVFFLVPIMVFINNILRSYYKKPEVVFYTAPIFILLLWWLSANLMFATMLWGFVAIVSYNYLNKSKGRNYRTTTGGFDGSFGNGGGFGGGFGGGGGSFGGGGASGGW